MTKEESSGRKKTERTLDLEINNSDLASLAGPLDGNLTQIENFLNVDIARRGSTFKITGSAAASQKAMLALKDLANMASRKTKDLTAKDIQLYLISQDVNKETEKSGEPAAGFHVRRKTLTARTPMQKTYIQNILGHDISFGIGPAGTGKTYLAVAAAADALEKGEVERIVLTRPVVEAGEKLGFLPGDLTQKVEPYLRPLYDALFDLLGADRTYRLLERQDIEIAPLAYMRGRTLNSSFVILDEAQNTSIEQMKMFLTRIGFGSKAVITGDVTQIDIPKGQRSGLVDATNVLRSVRGISFTYFTAADVVRHPLVARIVDAYEKARTGKNE